jgi:hypothetical protein
MTVGGTGNTACDTLVPLKTGRSTTLRSGTLVRLKRTQYDIAMSDCRVVLQLKDSSQWKGRISLRLKED